jgi:hypothetical protein
LTITCGIDWAEKHHDVALVDETGKLVAKRRLGDDVDGWRTLIELPAEHGDRPEARIPVATVFTCGGRPVPRSGPGGSM